MSAITIHGRRFVPFIPYSQLEKDIDRIAARMNADFRDSSQVPLLVCVLSGSILFAAELMKRLDFPLELAPIRVSSYRGTASSGQLEEVVGLTAEVKGRPAIIVEDIVDTGNTLARLYAMLQEKGASRISICTLLYKPEADKTHLPLDYVAREIPNRFVLGFGLDYDQLGRNLKDVYVLDEA